MFSKHFPSYFICLVRLNGQGDHHLYHFVCSWPTANFKFFFFIAGLCVKNGLEFLCAGILTVGIQNPKEISSSPNAPYVKHNAGSFFYGYSSFPMMTFFVSRDLRQFIHPFSVLPPAKMVCAYKSCSIHCVLIENIAAKIQSWSIFAEMNLWQTWRNKVRSFPFESFTSTLKLFPWL